MSRRILITTFTFPPQKNGVSHVVAAHATGLARLGYDITVATGLGQARAENTQDGVKVRQFATQGNGRCIRGGYDGDIRGYKEFVASFTGDLIICHCWQIWSTDLAVEVFGRVRCPKVLVSHGVSARWLRRSPSGLISWLEWKPYLSKMPIIIQKFDHIVLLSERSDLHGFYDRWVMDRIGYHQYSVIPNGVYLNRFTATNGRVEQFRAEHCIGRKPMLLYVANYDPVKNQKMAVEAFIKAALPEAVLVLAGSEINDYARSVQLFARKAGADGRQVIFLENQTSEDITAAYCAADLFICSSKWEIQPLMILDAMASCKPFVCTDVGCVREMPGGIIVRNLTEMVRAVRELMTDEPRRQQLGCLGLTAIKEAYTWEKIVLQYHALIEKLCSNRGVRQE